jgi:hypothetical protein
MSADFDKAIDRAVREMLDVEPRADLRERVMAQVTASGSRLPASGFRLPASGSRLPASGFRLPASGSLLDLVASGFSRNRVVVAAAAALIVLAVFLARREPVTPPAPIVAHGVDRHLPSEAAPVARAPKTAPRPAAPRVVVVARAAAPRIVVATVADNVDTTGIAPLTTITPIAAAPIEQERIAPAEIAVRPLNTITEIQIAPLTPPDRRD